MEGTLAFISFKGTPIKGAAKPDADGYYLLRVGEIGTTNTSGITYSSDASVRALFDENSKFVERIKNNQIYGEASHPSPAGLDEMGYKMRLTTMEPAFTSHHIRAVHIRKTKTPGKYEIWLELKPTGIYGDALKEALDDDNMNVSFSLRGFSRTDGNVRTLMYVVTFDWVHVPGIKDSNKKAQAESRRQWSNESDVLISVDMDKVEAFDMEAHSLESDMSGVPTCIGDICSVVKASLEADASSNKPFIW